MKSPEGFINLEIHSYPTCMDHVDCHSKCWSIVSSKKVRPQQNAPLIVAERLQVLLPAALQGACENSLMLAF